MVALIVSVPSGAVFFNPAFLSVSRAATTTTVGAPHARRSGGEEAGILPVRQRGAQRASTQRSARLVVFAFVAVFAMALGAAANPAATAAAGKKVVIVVGPAGSSTADYRSSARTYASVARSYGANVIEIYSPYATWSRVRAAAQGANVFIYLGHGNGYPSPYGAFRSVTMDGLGLNATSGNGNYNVRYWGEYYITHYIRFARNAVVILNRLCYASGNSEWGSANPTKSTAIRRVDNFGAGFLRANARAVFAEAITSVSYTIRALFTSTRTMDAIFMNHPSASGARDFWFSSVRTPGYRAHLDPPLAGKYWRSVIGTLTMTATTFRAG